MVLVGLQVSQRYIYTDGRLVLTNLIYTEIFAWVRSGKIPHRSFCYATDRLVCVRRYKDPERHQTFIGRASFFEKNEVLMLFYSAFRRFHERAVTFHKPNSMIKLSLARILCTGVVVPCKIAFFRSVLFLQS